METIIKKYLEGIATEEEQRSLLEWLREKKNRQVFNKAKSEWRDNVDAINFPGGGEESWNNLQGKLWQKSFQAWQISGEMQLIFRYAAIFLLIFTIGSLTYIINNRSKRTTHLNTRVLADKGQISKIELPDGSRLWLNSGSEVIYNNQFASGNREILLIGEAYFMVAKNTELPFIVTCNKIKVQAVGTQFNVSAYPGSECINILLADGSVELRHQNITSFHYVLKPGEMARYNTSDGEIIVTDVNTAKYTSWKDGIIHIYDQPFIEVIKRLELRYNQKFTCEEKVKDFRYTFTIKNESLDDVIRLMGKITPVKAIQQDNVIRFQLDKNKLRNVD